MRHNPEKALELCPSSLLVSNPSLLQPAAKAEPVPRNARPQGVRKQQGRPLYLHSSRYVARSC